MLKDFVFLFIQQQKNTHFGNEIYSLWITTGQLQNNSDVDQTIYQPIDQLVCVVYLSMFFFSLIQFKYLHPMGYYLD